MQPTEQPTHQVEIELRASDAQLIKEYQAIAADHNQQAAEATAQWKAVLMSAIRAAGTPIGPDCSYTLGPDGLKITGTVPCEAPPPAAPPVKPPAAPLLIDGGACGATTAAQAQAPLRRKRGVVK